MVSLSRLSRVAWNDLNSLQKSERRIALEVLRLMRKGNSLRSALKETGTNYNLAKAQLGRNIFKRKGRFFPTKTDSIQRSMEFYDASKGRIFVVAKNSKDASRIGEYFSAVKKAIEGDKSALSKFKGKTFKDASGKKHKFETRLEKIYDIEEGIEEPEFRVIYEETAP